MFDQCRAVEWSHFERYCSVYFRLALMERRLESAARLVGYAEQATASVWLRRASSICSDAARAELAQRSSRCVSRLSMSEGAKLEPEAVCRLTLGYE